MQKCRHFLVLVTVFLTASSVGQGIYERFPNRPEQLSVMVIGVSSNSQAGGFGSASLFRVPAGNNGSIYCAITAAHVLTNKATKLPHDSLILKPNMSPGLKPTFIKVPLKHNPPKSYWSSPSGLDLVAIPIPPKTLQGADFATFGQGRIVTPESASTNQVVPGLVVQVLCMQYEYMNALDFMMPETLPTLRVGHLSRLGFRNSAKGGQFVSSHVIDLHSSPGNSGAAAAVFVPSKDGIISTPMFLGIVQGFREEVDSFVPYHAPLTNAAYVPQELMLVAAESKTTNLIALSLRTVANPNLTFVTPVHELETLQDSADFQSAFLVMAQNAKAYEVMENLTALQK